MWAEEVVVGGGQGSESHGAVARRQVASRADVVLLGTIKLFDVVLEGAKFPGDRVEIFRTDHLLQGVGGWEGRR